MTSRGRRHETRALLLRRTDFGDSDLVLSFLTKDLGKIDTIARGARKSQRRFPGGLDPFFTLSLDVDEPAHGSLFLLRETRIASARLSLVHDLRAMSVAGRALGWLRSALPLRVPEDAVFTLVESWLDHLDARPPDTTLVAEARLSEFGLSLLHALGWALDLERCVRCGRACPDDKSSTLDPRQGGLVCRHCGGGQFHLTTSQRATMRAASRGTLEQLDSGDATYVLGIVEQTLLLHPGVES